MYYLKRHMEWVAFTLGLILMGSMDPTVQGFSFCFFDLIGLSFCPGEGLGHSMAYFFRGEFIHSWEAHFAGPFAVIFLSSRVITIWRRLYLEFITQRHPLQYGTSN